MLSNTIDVTHFIIITNDLIEIVHIDACDENILYSEFIQD